MIVIVVIIVTILVVAIIRGNNNKNRIANLKSQYEASLTGTDKKAALQAGRTYYSALRKDSALTIYDEQAITNDLSAIKLV